MLHGFSFVFQELGFFVLGLKVNAPYVQVVAICVLQRSIMVLFFPSVNLVTAHQILQLRYSGEASCISCQIQTIRSTNHNLLRYASIVPNRVGHRSNMSTPQIIKITEIAETAERTFGTVWWYAGTGTASRFSHTRSPIRTF